MLPFSNSATKDMVALMIALLAGAAMIGQPNRANLTLSQDLPQISVATSMASHASVELLATRGA